MVVRLKDNEVAFPPCNMALTDPDGLLAIGGKLNPEWLITAYKNGIFPWFSGDDTEILWWSPTERAVMIPGEMKVSKSLQKTLRTRKYKIKADRDFKEIINQCATNRNLNSDTWITVDMIEAYCELHYLGLSHCIGVYEDKELVGGLYGVAIGGIFCGESMFHLTRDASKIAFYFLNQYLKKQKYDLIDCQIMNPHLQSLGAYTISRDEFLIKLKVNTIEETNTKKWII
jgi:leucyl/phenylalanyl-tRNA--protein transferase